ncbi:hypothetical protein [uncultured Clostridium sp.]|uniref:hypothetical protein n=1 Tax=uncultured Clostridium sp. TaxID=59620 RepID=UPI00258F0755|nr:hypothetical protein [uncultured Clostridium sp.]
MKINNLIMTRKVVNAMVDSEKFKEEVSRAIEKYKGNDWGEACKSTADDNNMNLNGIEEIFAVYETCKGIIWIITEYERKNTTVLFSDEY